MATPEEKAQKIFMMFVRYLDPHHGILIKKHIKQEALILANLHCNCVLDEIDLILEKLGYRKDEYDDLDTIEYPLQRRKLYENVLIHLATMTKSLS